MRSCRSCSAPNGRAGRHEGGYTSPDEAAGEILHEAIEPFIEDMKRRLDLGLDDQALELCEGIVLGLYRVRDEHDGLLGYVPDFPDEEAGDVVHTWSRGMEKRKRSRAGLPVDFIETFVPEWTWLVKMPR